MPLVEFEAFFGENLILRDIVVRAEWFIFTYKRFKIPK